MKTFLKALAGVYIFMMLCYGLYWFDENIHGYWRAVAFYVFWFGIVPAAVAFVIFVLILYSREYEKARQRLLKENGFH